MGEYTLLRVDVDAGVVAMILDAVPGVEVDDHAIETGDSDGTRPPRATGPQTGAARSPTAPAGTRVSTPEAESPPPSTAAVSDDDSGGLAGLWQQWGLLGVGASLVVTGLGVVGLWWYRRRQSDDSDDERVTSDERHPGGRSGPPHRAPRETRRTARSATGPSTHSEGTSVGRAGERTDDGETGTDEHDDGSAGDEGSRAGDDSAADRERDRDADESPETDAGDSSTVLSDAGSDESAADSAPETTERRTGTRWPVPSERTGSMNVAPLLGMGFLAVAAVVVRWAQGARDAET